MPEPDALFRHLDTLNEPARVRLLWALEREELGAGELCRILQQPQSTVSRHLKALQIAGWIHRRAEGTNGWFRLADLDAVAARMWAVVGDEHARSPLAAEDAVRLSAVLDARRTDGRTFFGRMSGQWDAIRHELFGDAFLLPALCALLPPGTRVADLGCGTGQAIAALAPWAAQVIGVDREQSMLDAAATRLRGVDTVDLRLGPLEALPLDDGEVDAVLLSLVLHHVDDPPRALAEARRVLASGGRAIVVDMIAHDRAEYRWTMGHTHLGFTREAFAGDAARVGLDLRSWHPLPPAAEALGPPLFVAVLDASPVGQASVHRRSATRSSASGG